MDSVLRAVIIYFLLVGLFRVAGRRALNELSSFEFVLLLVIGEATQQAILGKDYSLTNAALVITTLIMLNVWLSIWKHRAHGVKRVFDGVPLVVVAHGRPLPDVMQKARVSEDEVMEAARELQGLERMAQIKYAVLESGGTISIIPRAEEQ
ncbi:MAG TPA: YetF domain-containing protein [Pyrinomonadaceae bacterium]|jgi:uncharacterized membrane protein YcaP (DUF421 family)